MQHLNGQAAQGEGVPLVVGEQALHLSGQGEQAAARPVGVSLVDIDLGLRIGLVKRRDGGGVVIVAVGQEDILHGDVLLPHHGQDALGLVSGINDGGYLSLLVLQDVAVGADGAHRHDFYFQGNPSYCSVSYKMVTGPSFTEATFISAPNWPCST